MLLMLLLTLVLISALAVAPATPGRHASTTSSAPKKFTAKVFSRTAPLPPARHTPALLNKMSTFPPSSVYTQFLWKLAREAALVTSSGCTEAQVAWPSARSRSNAAYPLEKEKMGKINGKLTGN